MKEIRVKSLQCDDSKFIFRELKTYEWAKKYPQELINKPNDNIQMSSCCETVLLVYFSRNINLQ